MTVATSYPHTQAVLALLTAASVKSGWDGEGLGDPPYVVCYCDPGMPDGYPFARDRSYTFTVYTVAVGQGPEQAAAIDSQARIALLGATPVVTGRVCQPIFYLAGQPPRADRDVSPPVFEMTAQYRFRSQPA